MYELLGLIEGIENLVNNSKSLVSNYQDIIALGSAELPGPADKFL